ncbi:acyl-CoA dehydrogenase family protein [Nocardioides sp. NPDC051685]|uniref:acyl-CoA dehydrogenase family protein n=1 Tax=Nocardioides sp. NPDC051685 TaxID=3364334 RepID=UPI00378F7EB5
MTDINESELRGAASAMLAGGPSAVTAEQLIETGWVDLLEDDERAAVASLFEEAGRTTVKTGALVHVAAHALGISGDDTSALCTLDRGHKRPASPDWNISGILTEGPPERRVIVWSSEVADPFVAVVDLHSIDSQPTEGADPTLGWHLLKDRRARTVQLIEQPQALRTVVALSRAVHYERLGAAEAMLDIAVAHVSERHQFGRPIGSYQAVQHRLVDVHVAVRAAHAALGRVWDHPGAIELMVAALKTQEAVDLAIQHTLQVCGGMGFTEEFPLGSKIRRVLKLGAIVPDPVALAAALGEQLTGGEQLPRLVDLRIVEDRSGQ